MGSVALALALLLSACGPAIFNPAFESTEESEVSVKGGDCATKPMGSSA